MGLIGVFVLSACFAGVLTQGEVHAAASTLTISVPDSISLDILPIYPNGTFETTQTTENNISVWTNHYTGYTLFILNEDYVVGDYNGELVYGGDDVISTISTIPSTIGKVSEDDYRDDTYVEANNLNNTWGIRPSKYYDASTGTTVDNEAGYYFSTRRGTSCDTNLLGPCVLELARTTLANGDDSDGYNIAIGARVDVDTPVGLYENVSYEGASLFSIVAIVNPMSYKISYEANAGDDMVTNMPEDEEGIVDYYEGGTVYISENIPERDGFKFDGWCFVQTSDNQACPSDQTLPIDPEYNGTPGHYRNYIVLDETTINDVTIYATWRKALSITYMQDFKDLSSEDKASLIDSMEENFQYTLLDERDNKEYYVAKLADGNVWMTQNLDHDIVPTAGFYTPENTDIPETLAGEEYYPFDTYVLSLSDLERTVKSDGNIDYISNDHNWHNDTALARAVDFGEVCWDGTIGQGSIVQCTGANREYYNNQQNYSLGNYYNLTAALAMKYSGYYWVEEVGGNEPIDQSICPAGWKLPGMSGDKSYSKLKTDLGLTAGTNGNLQENPVHFVYGGYVSSVSNDVKGIKIANLGYGGQYRLNTITNKNGQYSGRLYFDNATPNPSFYGANSTAGRSTGITIRCVAR